MIKITDEVQRELTAKIKLDLGNTGLQSQNSDNDVAGKDIQS